VPEGDTLIAEPKAVEGSNGLLLEIDGQIVPNYDATIVPFSEGDVVSGNVVRIDKDEVLVDIGYKSEGVIPSNELSIRKSANPHDEVELGEEVDALVLTKEDQDGRLVLSKKRARFEKAWRKIEAAAESGEPVEGSVIEVVKGGLIIDLGVRGFLPASLVDIRRVQNLDEFLGQMIECKVIELNRSRNNVVLSRRAVLEEERKEVRQQILDRLQPGQIVEGAISNIVDFGAFVDLDGIDGLIHISELSWSHVNHPSEILSIGQVVPVKVLDIDRDRQRISLGLKQTQEDPWQRVVDTYALGDELEGKVTKVVSFGAFVEILDGVEGLVHISELAQHHVENPREVVNQGDVIKVKILEIDSERRRLSLSAKRVEGQELPLRTGGGEYAPPAEGDGGEELGEVRDLGLSDDVFAGGDAPAEPEGEGEAAPAPEGDAAPAPADEPAPAPDAAPAEGDAAPAEAPPVADDAVAAEGDTAAAPAADAAAAPDEATAPAPDAPAPGDAISGASADAVEAEGDAVVHELLATDEVRDELVERFGPEIAPEGKIDRDRMAEVVFADPDKRKALEEYLWPKVGERIWSWREELAAQPEPPPAAVVEVPLLFESGMDQAFDHTIAVSADDDLRNERIGARGHTGVASREKRQMPQDEKARRADFAVRNDGTVEELEEVLTEILERIAP
jgi:small subunit ribosomal protein S1